MTSRTYTTMESLITSSSRLPFTADDAKYVLSTIKKFHAHGFDLLFHPSFTGSAQEHLNEGLLILTSESLQSDFGFLKVNAGRGFFGGQKYKIQAFVGSVFQDQVMPVRIFANLVTALASVHSIYRTRA